MSTIFAFIIGLFLLYIIGIFLVIPVRIIMKLIVNGVLGGLILLIFNLFGGLIGLNIAITPLAAIIAGFLGVPGIILLLIIKNFS